MNASVCVLLLCVGVPWGSEGGALPQTKQKHSRCVLCDARLDKVKHSRPHGVGRACAPRCKTLKRSADDAPAAVQDDSTAAPATAVAARPEKRVRRAKSDPGEQIEKTNTRLRARTYAAKKKPLQKTRKNPPSFLPAPSSSLDETHARRLALLASATASTSSSSSPSARK